VVAGETGSGEAEVIAPEGERDAAEVDACPPGVCVAEISGVEGEGAAVVHGFSRAAVLSSFSFRLRTALAANGLPTSGGVAAALGNAFINGSAPAEGVATLAGVGWGFEVAEEFVAGAKAADVELAAGPGAARLVSRGDG
jgi:hypothetical protein